MIAKPKPAKKRHKHKASILQDEWKDIKGFEGIYQISSKGQVRSADRIVTQMSRYGKYINRTIKGKLIKATDNGNGYLIVGLQRKLNGKNFYIHRLVAEHFINEIPNGYVVNHKDFNKHNNSFENLEIITQKDNVIYSKLNMCVPRKKFKSVEEKYIHKRKSGNYEVTVNKKYLGSYVEKEEALRVRDAEVGKWQNAQQA